MKRRLLFIGLILSVMLNAFAYEATVNTGDTDSEAQSELIKVLQQGGKITFGEGTWTIKLSGNDVKALADIEIVGANLTDPTNPDNFGAYEDAEFVKTTLKLTGSPIVITESCDSLKISNIKWERATFKTDKFHAPKLDCSNVFFDLNDWSIGYWGKVIFAFSDGASGSLSHCSFRNFGYSTLWLNRSVAKGVTPTINREKLVIDRCYFQPDAATITGQCTALGHDGGNDEYAPTWDHAGTEIRNSKFVDTRITVSKGSNLKIIGNEIVMEQSKKEPIHLEEFSHNIQILDNTFIFKGDFNHEAINLGAVATCTDILIDGNRLEHEGQVTKFVQCSGAHDITITNNEIVNPVADAKYITMWGCGNYDITVGPNQTGLDASHQDIKTTRCSYPINDGFYYVYWGEDEYLGLVDGEVKLLKSESEPEDNAFIWELKLHVLSKLENFYSFQNQEAEGYYLEVYKGPTAPEQQGTEGTPYILFNEKVIPEAYRDYEGMDRVPGFGIYESEGKYALLSGGNERRSEIIKDGDQLSLYVVKNETTAHHQWSFTKTRPYASINNIGQEKRTIYPNPCQDILNIKGKPSNWKIYAITGMLIQQGSAQSIDISTLPQALYCLSFEDGERHFFSKD